LYLIRRFLIKNVYRGRLYIEDSIDLIVKPNNISFYGSFDHDPLRATQEELLLVNRGIVWIIMLVWVVLFWDSYVLDGLLTNPLLEFFIGGAVFSITPFEL
jgi:hypothetical protein